MKLKIDDKLMYGDYSDEQIEIVVEEMKKPKDKRRYRMGIEFSEVNRVEVIEE